MRGTMTYNQIHEAHHLRTLGLSWSGILRFMRLRVSRSTLRLRVLEWDAADKESTKHEVREDYRRGLDVGRDLYSLAWRRG